LNMVKEAQQKLRSTQINWQEPCLFEADDILTGVINWLEKHGAEEVDEFNAGYSAFEQGLNVDDAEILYRAALPDDVPSHDTFAIGYAWAKYQKEQGIIQNIANNKAAIQTVLDTEKAKAAG
jgi:hypothetical protein